MVSIKYRGWRKGAQNPREKHQARVQGRYENNEVGYGEVPATGEHEQPEANREEPRKSGEPWLDGEDTGEGAAIQRPMFMERKQRSPQVIYGKYNFKK